MLFQVKKKNNKVWIPDRCSWAANKSSRWPDFWFKGKLFFHAFKYRWSHICKTLKDSNSGLQNRILSCTSRKCGGLISDTPRQWCTPKITNVDTIQSPQSHFTPVTFFPVISWGTDLQRAEFYWAACASKQNFTLLKGGEQNRKM